MTSIGSTSILRQKNRRILLGLLARHQQMSRSQMARETGLTAAAVSRITREMISAGVLFEGEAVGPTGRAGRREVNLSINADAAFVLAVTLTANRKSVALANASGDILAIDQIPDTATIEPLAVLKRICEYASSQIAATGIDRRRLVGVGVSAALSATSTADLVTSGVMGWRDVPVRSVLSNALQLPVAIGSRASALLIAEMSMRPDVSSLYLVNVALSIGASACLGGRVLAPWATGFGALSHLVVAGDSTRCQCGRIGCLEACASGRSVLARLGLAVDLDRQVPANILSDAVRRADGGDGDACKAFWAAGQNLGRGLDAVVSLLNPAKVILTGEVGRQQHYCRGVLAGLQAAGCPDFASVLEKGRVSSAEAAVCAALDQFVFSEKLDLDRLRAA